jgi:hypothetical protein
MGKKKRERELTKGEKSPALFAQPDPRAINPMCGPLSSRTWQIVTILER